MKKPKHEKKSGNPRPHELRELEAKKIASDTQATDEASRKAAKEQHFRKP